MLPAMYYVVVYIIQKCQCLQAVPLALQLLSTGSAMAEPAGSPPSQNNAANGVVPTPSTASVAVNDLPPLERFLISQIDSNPSSVVPRKCAPLSVDKPFLRAGVPVKSRLLAVAFKHDTNLTSGIKPKILISVTVESWSFK